MPLFIFLVQYQHSCFLGEKEISFQKWKNTILAGLVENLCWLYLTDTHLPLRVMVVPVVFLILEGKGIYCGMQVLLLQ